jgi:hypothetical protein
MRPPHAAAITVIFAAAAAAWLAGRFPISSPQPPGVTPAPLEAAISSRVVKEAPAGTDVVAVRPGAPGTGGGSPSAVFVAASRDSFDDVFDGMLAGKIPDVERTEDLARLIQSGHVSPERVRRAFRERTDFRGTILVAMALCLHRSPELFPEYVADALWLARGTDSDALRGTVLLNIVPPHLTFQDATVIADYAQEMLRESHHESVVQGAIHALRYVAEFRDEYDPCVVTALSNMLLAPGHDASVAFALRHLNAIAPDEFDLLIPQLSEKRRKRVAELVESLRMQRLRPGLPPPEPR